MSDNSDRIVFPEEVEEMKAKKIREIQATNTNTIEEPEIVQKKVTNNESSIMFPEEYEEMQAKRKARAAASNANENIPEIVHRDFTEESTKEST